MCRREAVPNSAQVMFVFLLLAIRPVHRQGCTVRLAEQCLVGVELAAHLPRGEARFHKTDQELGWV